MKPEVEIHIGEPYLLIPADQEAHARVEIPYLVNDGTEVKRGLAEVRRRVIHHVRSRGKGEAPTREERHKKNELFLLGPDLPEEHRQKIHDKAAAVFKAQGWLDTDESQH